MTTLKLNNSHFRTDSYGQVFFDEDQLCDILLQDRQVSLEGLILVDPREFNESTANMYLDYPVLKQYQKPTQNEQKYHNNLQKRWKMPQEYSIFDVENYLLSLCQSNEEIERVRIELDLFRKNNLISLLQYVKYLNDTLRKENILFGIGRGSSVSCYVFYLLGLHRIDSIKYNLNISEFFKESTNEENV